MTTTRRKFLELGWKIGGTLLGLASGWTVFESLRPLAGNTGGATFKLGDPATYAACTATYISNGSLYVTNPGDTIFALSQKCPHLGCRVPFCASSGRFECGCHGSVYDLGGEWVQGPAPRGMDRFPVTIQDGQVVVDTSTVVTGPDHGANTYLTAPKGPSCLGGG